MKIDIWSDYVCPFCTLGARYLDIALDNLGVEAEITWHHFELDPSAPEDGSVSVIDHLTRSKGMSEQDVRTMTQMVADKAAEVGLEFNFDDAISARTFTAHRLGALANDKGLGDAFDRAAKRAFFTEGKNLGDAAVLTELAVNCGLDEGDVAKVLGSEDYSDEVNVDIAAAAQIGVRGVPFFVFDEKLAVQGAQPVEVFEKVIRDAS